MIMDVNKSLFEISRGEWAFHVDLVSLWLPTAIDIIERKAISLPKPVGQNAITFLNQNGSAVSAIDVIEQNTSDDVVAVVSSIGPLMRYSGLCNKGADAIANEMKMAMNLPSVKGVVNNVDGPGGSVSSVSVFQELKASINKPVVSVVDLCASAHYWSACLISDHIMARNNISSEIGSVGVMVSFLDNSEALQKQGYKLREIYAPESNHKNKAFTLAREGKYDMIKEEYLSPSARKFQADVRAARPNLVEETGVLTGKTFKAEKALEYGMIDSIGSMQKAIDQVLMLAEIKEVNNY